MIYDSRLWHWLAAVHLTSLLTTLLVLAFVSLVLKSRRAPQTTWAWLLAVVLVPYIGIPLFLAFGRRKFTRIGRPARFPSRSSNATLSPSGEETFRLVKEAILKARTSIDICVYIFSRDAAANEILMALIAAAGRGVRVRLLLDAWGSNILVRANFRELRAAGAEIRYFGPLLHNPFRLRTNLRNHRKLMIFDGLRAWAGGMNVAEEYMGPVPDSRRWIDVGMWTDGPLIEDLQCMFDRDWGAQPAPPTVGGGVATFERNVENHICLLASGPDTAEDAIYETILQWCFDAKESLTIVTPYFVPNEFLNESLLIARKRGIAISIVTPLRSNHRLADRARASYFEDLQTAGCRIFAVPHMIHAKVIVKDHQRALLGSANFDTRSLFYNFEIGIELGAAAIVADIESWIKTLEAKAVPWIRSNRLADRWLENLARTVALLL